MCIRDSVKRVNYVGLKDNSYYALAQRQFGPTAGAMITIDLDSKEACFAFKMCIRDRCNGSRPPFCL